MVYGVREKDMMYLDPPMLALCAGWLTDWFSVRWLQSIGGVSWSEKDVCRLHWHCISECKNNISLHCPERIYTKGV